MRKHISLFLLCALLFTGCSNNTPGLPASMETAAPQDTSTPEDTAQTEESGSVQSIVLEVQDMFTDRDLRADYEESTAAVINLNDQAAGSTVTVSNEGTYVLQGKLTGSVTVNAEKTDKIQLVLDGVDIHSETSAAIYILQADKVFITLAEGSANYLSTGESFVAIDENNIDGAIFSKDDLTLNGAGSLTLTCPAGHGIVSKDDLVVAGGSYTIDAASHGISGRDSIRIADGNFSITAGKDGIHAENNEDTTLGFGYLAGGSYTITAEGDGISAVSCLQIDGGIYHITAGGGSANAEDHFSSMGGGMGGGPGGGMGGGMRPGKRSTAGDAVITAVSSDNISAKALKCDGELVINGGSFTIDCADDAVHSNLNITVTEGTFQISSGDDGFHADEALLITGGTIAVTESYEGLEALHIQISGGDITLKCTDDGLNAAGGNDSSGFGGMPGGDMFRGGASSDGTVEISGGKLYMNASGDGIDANGSLVISGGFVNVCGPTQGDTAVLDYDVSATITGGTFIGTGSHMMAQTFSSSEQGVVAVSVGNQSAGTQITLTDVGGNVLISNSPALSFAIVILSSEELVKGQSYTISVGSQSGTFEAS